MSSTSFAQSVMHDVKGSHEKNAPPPPGVHSAIFSLQFSFTSRMMDEAKRGLLVGY